MEEPIEEDVRLAPRDRDTSLQVLPNQNITFGGSSSAPLVDGEFTLVDEQEEVITEEIRAHLQSDLELAFEYLPHAVVPEKAAKLTGPHSVLFVITDRSAPGDAVQGPQLWGATVHPGGSVVVSRDPPSAAHPQWAATVTLERDVALMVLGGKLDPALAVMGGAATVDSIDGMRRFAGAFRFSPGDFEQFKEHGFVPREGVAVSAQGGPESAGAVPNLARNLSSLREDAGDGAGRRSSLLLPVMRARLQRIVETANAAGARSLTSVRERWDWLAARLAAGRGRGPEGSSGAAHDDIAGRGGDLETERDRLLRRLAELKEVNRMHAERRKTQAADTGNAPSAACSLQ